jgi:hypothetical protein
MKFGNINAGLFTKISTLLLVTAALQSYLSKKIKKVHVIASLVYIKIYANLSGLK